MSNEPTLGTVDLKVTSGCQSYKCYIGAVDLKVFEAGLGGSGLVSSHSGCYCGQIG